MKKLSIALTLALAFGPMVVSLHADDAPVAHENWFSFGPQFGLNLNARFKYLGNANSSSPGPASGGGLNRTYDDGYVKVDSSGNAGGQTWNWGYQNSGQVQGNAVTMHSSSASVNGTKRQDDNLGAGFDLAFGRNLGTVLGGKWGLQAAFDFTTISIHDSHPLTGTGTTISDAYSLGGGVSAPQAPYAGSFTGPGALLGDSPTRTTASQTILITGSRTLEAQVYVLRLGPYFEFPFGQHWAGRFGGGLALGLADTKYSFNETINFGGGPSLNNSGSSEGVSFQAGGYLEGKLLYAVTPRASLFAGAQFENLGTFSRNARNEQAQLGMSSMVNLMFGLEWNF